MARYAVTMMNVVSTTVDVEADSSEEAADKALMDGVPGLMFLDHTYPDEGDWYVEDEEFDVRLVEE